jgi:Zn-dependent protease with chaperone function
MAQPHAQQGRPWRTHCVADRGELPATLRDAIAGSSDAVGVASVSCLEIARLAYERAGHAPLDIQLAFREWGHRGGTNPHGYKVLESEVLAEAKRAGVEGVRVFEVNKSVDTAKVNAYVTGVGSSKRIVLWDTLIARLRETPSRS